MNLNRKKMVKTGFSLKAAPYSKLQAGDNEGLFGGAVLEKIEPKKVINTLMIHRRP
jgi:hypothetical protein